ncbi:RNA-binding S4 domain-containing protein [Falsirhodobacter halotolerans]|uniref:RNA-binding S4 domain-containing protein n=1 Tax=Falsirhodobacter halotolerans TaxID=1146892 RepID=UPI001FD61D42|nr:RNA-binding S4 domain-containing protein [Falsirhodobacter halotolerans]MCJ8140333.1 RNA-binding S4 domain-containing protein [Falsirhodobacter halotolerans]
MIGDRPTTRLDKWLVQARFFKTRSLALAVITARHVRINGQKASKPSAHVGQGDTLTFPQGNRIRVVRVMGLAERRGPASEAQGLYLDLNAVPPPDALSD